MIRTWHVELAVVGATLAATAAITSHTWTAWLAAVAVLLSFGHAQITDRLAEREASRARPAVECHRQALLYFIGKEIAWCGFFIATRAWPALVGVALFLLYPVWRRMWRTRRPLDRSMVK